MKVAAIQLNVSADPAKNLPVFEQLVREAASQGADLIATPECSNFLSVSAVNTRSIAVAQNQDSHLRKAQDLAAELKVWILLGSLVLQDPHADKLANRQVLVSPTGQVQTTYDKIHLFDVSIPDGQSYAESRSYHAGNQAVVSHIDDWCLGHAICFDLRFPNLFQVLGQAGAEILAIPAAFTQLTGQAHWHVLLRARAIETGCYVIAPAQCGTHDGGRQTYGHALIISPWGEILAEAGDAPGLITADLDKAAITQARQRIPTLDLAQPIAMATKMQ